MNFIQIFRERRFWIAIRFEFTAIGFVYTMFVCSLVPTALQSVQVSIDLGLVADYGGFRMSIDSWTWEMIYFIILY